MKKDKIKNFFIVFLLIMSIFAMNPIIKINASTKTEISPKYIIAKIDDFGFGNWTPILRAFQNNPNYVADIGVIGYDLQRDTTNQHILTELLATGRIDIFNHGWDHVIPEFQNRTLDYMVKHINLWNQFMYQRYGLKNEFILGAPGNAIGNKNNCSEPIYQAMNETGYKILYFSSCNGTTNDGSAGLDIPYLYVENDCAAGCHFNPVSYTSIEQGLQRYAQNQTIFMQVHFADGQYWNYTNIVKFLNFIYSQSGRIGITMTNYYNQIFLPSHPNYFLRNTTNQFINSETNITTSTSAPTITTMTTTTIISTQNDLISQPFDIGILLYGVMASIVIIFSIIKKIKI